MSWKTLMKMMTDKHCPRNEIKKLEMELWELKVKGTDLASYTNDVNNQRGTGSDCPRNEIKKLEMELWELKVKGTDLASYTQRFHELALLCGRMFSEEADKIEKYVRGLPDMIHGNVVASKPKTMQEAIEIATELMDKKNTGRVYTAASGGKKQYGGSRPLCAKCNYHHEGPCAPKCHNCNKVGHSASDCRSVANTNNANNQRGTRRNNAAARVYALGHTGTDPNANVIM
nr:hypothetical protein [Tanacetum cinerariifolium]